MLMAALTGYHNMARDVVAKAGAEPDLLQKCGSEDAKGVLRPNRFRAAKYVRGLVPGARSGWAYGPLRDYLIRDMEAALMSHLAKEFKGKNASNPPTIGSLEKMSDAEFRSAYDNLVLGTEFAVKPEHREKIDKAKENGQTQVARRLENIFTSRAQTKAAAQILKKLDGAEPRPIEFLHCELTRGLILARRNGKYYALAKLFSDSSRYSQRDPVNPKQKRMLETGFINLKDGKDIGGKRYPGVVLPLELGREFHEDEYLRNAKPQSAKLLMRRNERGQPEFYVHIAFEFHPVPVTVETVLGLDRGAAKIGSACVLDLQGNVVEDRLNMEGAAFAAEMKQHSEWIAREQSKGNQKNRRFKLRGRRADALLGEYANALIAKAVEHKSQIVLEKIDGVAMARFLKQSQFAKLKQMLCYKALRMGLPEPKEIPAARTSQTCGICGHWARENRPKKDAEGKSIQDVFLCVECGYKANADENAAKIIALRGLQQMQSGGRGAKFTKWVVFEPWLKTILGRDGQATVQ
jgi:transposase